MSGILLLSISCRFLLFGTIKLLWNYRPGTTTPSCAWKSKQSGKIFSRWIATLENELEFKLLWELKSGK
jgi:hypothetical protein